MKPRCYEIDYATTGGFGTFYCSALDEAEAVREFRLLFPTRVLLNIYNIGTAD